MPRDQLSVARVFFKLKDAFKDIPSLTVADYSFKDTLLKGVDKKTRDRVFGNIAHGFSSEALGSGDHDVFCTGISGDDILGIFFQIKGTTPKACPKTLKVSLGKANKQIQKDIIVFKTVCGKFLEPFVKLAGFPAFPMLNKSDLRKVIDCVECRARILTSEDISDPQSFTAFLKRQGIALKKSWSKSSPVMKTFKEIFHLYVCAASSVDLPRNPTQLYTKVEEQMQRLLMILTPQQRELVKSNSKVIFMTGTSGTGKTFVLKERASRLALENGAKSKEHAVLVVNLSGGDLTDEFQQSFKGKMIKVVDGRVRRLEDDLQGLKDFLKKEGRRKHVLIDEVPITLGFTNTISTEALSAHWEWVDDLEVNSITIAFRPNDQSYTRDFPLEEVNPAGHAITVLKSIKRNAQQISELFLDIGNFSRRVFLSSERSLWMDIDGEKREFSPRFFEMISCQALHRECTDTLICEIVRASHTTQAIYEECRKSPKKRAIFVVISDAWKRDAFLNVLTFLYPELPILFCSNPDKFIGKTATAGSFPLVVVTEEEMIGCHPKNLTVVIDFPHSQWQYYTRLVATTGENKIFVIEEEEWKTGRFSGIRKLIPRGKIEKGNVNVEDLQLSLERAWQEYKEKDVEELDKANFTEQSFPEIDMEDDDVSKMLRSRISGIFGYPASGKSRKVDELIGKVAGEVIILHCGGLLSHKLHRQRWETKANVYVVQVSSQKVTSIQSIINEALIKKNEEGRRRKMEGKEKDEGEEADRLTVVVEDCPLLELPRSMKEIQDVNMKLILVFKPHLDPTSKVTVEEVVKSLKENEECAAIELALPPTNMALLKHIQENETPAALRLDAKNLSLPAMPAAFALSPPVQYITMENEKCKGQHRGYICRGGGTCGKSATVLPSLLHSLPLNVKKDGEFPHILISHEGLLIPLKNTFEKSRLVVKVKHLKDFRGCEASVIISFNVSDEWLLEVLSRSRTQLIIIDNLPEHHHLWRTIMEKGHLERKKVSSSAEDDPSILLELDVQEKYLECPTWDEAGNRIGSDALKRGKIIDGTTGAFSHFLPIETQKAISEELFSSAPFIDWGYVWLGDEGEVPKVDEDRRKSILQIVKQNGVEWKNGDDLPVALETRCTIASGVFAALSLSLSGSLLHFPLLKEILGDENTEDTLLLIQSASDLLKRPIVLIRESTSCDEGEVPKVDEDRRKSILQIVKQNGVEWKNGDDLPVALETRCTIASGVFAALSLSLSGSLLHFPLLKEILGDENTEDTLLLIQSASDLLKRPIVLIRESTSWTFLPQGGGDMEWNGILLFARDDSFRSVHPIVHCVDKQYRQYRHDRLDLQFRQDNQYRLDRLDSHYRHFRLDPLNHQSRLYRQSHLDLLGQGSPMNAAAILGSSSQGEDDSRVVPEGTSGFHVVERMAITIAAPKPMGLLHMPHRRGKEACNKFGSFKMILTQGVGQDTRRDS
ncbi:unnamed protein product [Darwinula stevensoni]|uniref:Uncharacterized protein n=1 Tax=Darwinula stevensoni TaxID=69355 RepID=A0A7R9A322_9CRUS|nr:unnamed protein product [Darwinula stevensoni]CAG0890886.1 unnamed protein product [Darwinula stevensoni]